MAETKVEGGFPYPSKHQTFSRTSLYVWRSNRQIVSNRKILQTSINIVVSVCLEKVRLATL